MPVRALAYYRCAVGEPVETRVTHQFHDAAGRLTEQRDPRLFALAQSGVAVPPNLVTIPSLSGQPLCSDSVDAGWQVSLSGAAGQPVESWDQRGWHRRTELDALLRPVAIFEHFPDEPERCAERINRGSSSPDDALHNRCGQPVRHDDPAGSRLLPEYGLSGAVMAEVRHFLDSLDPPDWPLAEAERDTLLEPGDGLHSAWHFAATGEALSQIDAKGHLRQFAQDRAGQLRDVRLQRVGQPAAETLVSAIEYNAFGQIQQELAGNGMRTFSTYDPADGHLLSLANQGPDGVFLQNLSYRYDPAGNITEITDAALPIQHFANQRIEPVRRFTYDTLYQLIKANGWETAKPSFGPALPEWQAFGPPDASRWRNYSETYHYDEAGNLLERIHVGAENDTLTMQVAVHSNRSIKERPGADLEALFDARGNLLELQPGQALQWNGRNELAEVTQVARLHASDDLERYVYDGEGMRLRKWRSAVAHSITHAAEVRYLPGIELHTNSATGEQLQVVSVQAGRCSVRLLHWDGPPPDGVENDQLRYCFDDHLGSSTFEVDAQAKPISQEVYYPFGGTACLAGRNAVETSYKTIRYSGKERDATGLYYYGARYYVPWLQRWLNPDPEGDVDGLNYFRFVRSNPLGYVDQDGYLPTSLSDFLLETKEGVRDKVEQRGMNNIRKYMPWVAVVVDEAFQELKKTLTYALAELESGNVDSGLFENYFGTGQATSKNIEYFISGFREMLLETAHIQRNQERLVSLKGRGGRAFVMSEDNERKIYFYSDVFEDSSIQKNAFVLGHELTHLNTVFNSEDYWYLPELPNDAVSENYSKNLMHDSSVSMGTFKDADEQAIISKTGAVDMDQAVRKFEESPSLRTSLALHNADTLIDFAKALSESMQRRG
ncbi:MAG: RHS repeat-associated core domain-containing protein [Pseudomonas caspiana]